MNKAKNLSKYFWVQGKDAAGFQSSRAYGVINPEGKALSRDGVMPSTYGTLKTAKEIALHCDGFTNYSWIDIYPSVNDALCAARQ